MDREVSILSYEGPGTMFERSDGLVVFTHDEDDPWAVGFNLHWDKETMKAADEGEFPLLDVVGWLQIQYDTETGGLDVQWTDELGQVFETAYALNSRGKSDPSDFLAYVIEFFEYMRGEVQFAGTVAATDCSGGACYCTAQGCSCGTCCPAGFTPSCSCSSRCICKCIKVDTA